MAPESERANMSMCANCDAAGPPISGDPCAECGHRMTLTCSEVVERLATELDVPELLFDRAKAEKILHSWRERRVQELEEALRQIADGNTGCERCSQMSVDAERALAKSDEWREQIRKGANHE